MKSTVLFTVLLSVSSMAFSQSMHSCCQAPSATSAFASLGSDERFRNAHEAPLPAEFAALGRMITFKTPDGKSSSAYFLPAKKQSKNYLIVFHEWWGLNDYIKKQSDLFADSLAGINIMALDLYDGKVAANADEASKLMQATDETRAQNIIKGALEFAGEDAKVATVGWCFGGGWSLKGALISGGHLQGCVMYYGMPEPDVNKLKSLNGDVLFIWPNQDKWINEGVKNDFVKNMKEAGKNLTVKEYNADHAFANPSNPRYNKEAGEDAMRNTLVFLRSAFAR